MKKNILFSMMVLAAGPLLAAPQDDVKAAATALGDAANYSWQTTLDMGANSPFQMGPTDGKTEKGGYTTVSSTMMDNTSTVVLKGTNAAVQSENGWQTVAEATAGGGGGGFNPGMFAARQAQNLKLPAVEATNLLSSASDLKVDGDKITGGLTTDGVKSLMSFGGFGRRGGGPGGAAPEITNPKGTVTFWITGGKLTKYAFHVSGSMDRGGEPFEMDRTTTVAIKDVGTTKVEVPADAKKKLE